jgi:large subunit ribosomal protein L15
MPLQRRLPKFGFTSHKVRDHAELRLDKLAGIDAEVIDLPVLKGAGLIPSTAKRVKIIASGALSKPVSIKGIAVTKGARAAIEAPGGKVGMIEATQTEIRQ